MKIGLKKKQSQGQDHRQGQTLLITLALNTFNLIIGLNNRQNEDDIVMRSTCQRKMCTRIKRSFMLFLCSIFKKPFTGQLMDGKWDCVAPVLYARFDLASSN